MKLWIPALLLLLLVQPAARAQPAFDSPRHISVASDLVAPRHVAAADLNGDGNLDAVVLGSGVANVAANLVWFPGNGVGGFSTVRGIGHVANLTHTGAFPVDADLDGDIDVVTGSEDGVVLFRNQGSGQFTREMAHLDPASHVSLRQVTDIDGDSDPDFLALRSWSDLSWYENDGSGGLVRHEVHSPRPSDARVADVNGDGHGDIVVSLGGAPLELHVGDGSGGFRSAGSIRADRGERYGHTLYPSRCELADFNLDGAIDLTCHDGGGLYWQANDGAAGFGPPIASGDPGWIESMSIADVDGDGFTDLITGTGEPLGQDNSFTNANVGWHRNDGVGAFGERQVLSHGFYAQSVAVADFTGDLLPNLLVAFESEDALVLISQETAGTFSSSDLTRSDLLVANSIQLADLDADGDLDVLASSSNEHSQRSLWYPNLGGGLFGRARLVGYLLSHSPQVGDLDGDGDLDVAAANYNSGGWVANDGQGDFGSRLEVPVIGQHLRLGDLNGDGWLDVLSASPGPDHEYAGQQRELFAAVNRDGEFASGVVYFAGGAAAMTPETADMDGDGDQDVVAIHAGHPESSLLFYQGLGTELPCTPAVGCVFDRPAVVASAGTIHPPVLLADLDGDGMRDIAAASVDGSPTWFPHEGPGSFGGGRPVTERAELPHTLSAADLDSDGDLDLLASYRGPDGEVGWYRNDGSGTFGPFEPIIGGLGAESLMGPIWSNSAPLDSKPGFIGVYADAGDLDGDGDTDIVWAVGNTIAWQENQGTSVDLRGGQSVPSAFALHTPWPNPFAESASLRYDVPTRVSIRLELVDVLGRRVRLLAEGPSEAGRHQLVLDSTDLLPGAYVLRLTAGSSSVSRTVVKVR